MELPIYQVTLDDGIRFISLVENPAIKENFLAFKDQLKFSITDKHLITGPLMVANTPIYRRDEVRGEYYVLFTPEVIREMAEKLLYDKRTTDVNIEHNDEVDGLVIQEIYIKDSNRGISPKEFEDVPDGSLFITYKVNNPDIWNDIKENKFKGFSLEGTFYLEEDLYTSILKDLNKLKNVKWAN